MPEPISVDDDDTTTGTENQKAKSAKFVFDATLSTAVAANGRPAAKAPKTEGPLTPDMLDKMNRYWRAMNYLCIGQIYLFKNPLLRELHRDKTSSTFISIA